MSDCTAASGVLSNGVTSFFTCGGSAALGAVGDAAGAVGSAIAGGVGDITKSAATSALDDIAKSILNGTTEMLKVLASSWVNIPTPTDPNSADWLQSSLLPYTAIVAAASLIAAAAKVALTGRGEHARTGVTGLVRFLAVYSVGASAVYIGINWGDQFSTWVINLGTANDPSGHIDALSASVTAVFNSSAIQILLGLIALLGSLIQIALMFLRMPLLVVVIALWPMAAAASSTDAGFAWYRKLTGWLFAIVLYKPVAAVIYATAFHMMTVSNDPQTVLGGIALTVAALIALPALMRFFVPMVAAAGGGKGAGLAVASMAAGAVALGTAAASVGASSAPIGASKLISGNGSHGGDGPTGAVANSTSNTPSGSSGSMAQSVGAAIHHSANGASGAVDAAAPEENQ